MAEIVEAALGFAARGWPVFPCAAGGNNAKRPLTPNGWMDASTDADQIRQWWREFPGALIGLPTGARLGAFVVDLDPKEKAVDAILADLEAALGEPIADRLIAETQSGGWHLYFAWPAGEGHPEIRNRGRMLPGVDVRGEGGYVIAPPSQMANGAAYRWLSGRKRALPAPPALLLDMILRRGRFGEAKASARPGPVSADEAQRRYALAALDRELERVRSAPDGARNTTLNEASFALGQLVAAGALAESVVRAALEHEASAWPNIRKSRGTINSGVTAGLAQPRDLSGVSPHPSRSTAAGSWARADPPSRGDEWSAGDHGDDDGAGDDGSGAADLDADTLRACAALEPNDTGNGHRFLAWHSDSALFVRDVGWTVWNGRHWDVEGGAEAVSRMAQETARRIRQELPFLEPTQHEAKLLERAEEIRAALGESERPNADGELKARPPTVMERTLLKEAEAVPDAVAGRRKARARHALGSGNKGKLEAMLAVASTHACVGVDDLDAEPLAINVQNGTLRVVSDPECSDKTVRLDPHRQEDRFTRIVNAAFDPDADCPRWEAFVSRFLPDENVRWWVQRWHGYALTGLTSAQLLTFNHGLGANGKTTFTEALRRIMGNYAAALPAEAVTGEQNRRSDQATPEWARLPGVRLVLVGELPRNQQLRDETIKLMTGGEPMLVRHLHQGFFELRPTFKAVMTGNHKPAAAGSDYAVWRRLRLVPWTVRLEESERRPMSDVLDEFDAEAAGVLNWLIKGLIGFFDEGLKAPDAILDATEEYRSEVDPVGEFIRDCVSPRPDAMVPAREMFEAYISWAKANAVREMSENRFAKEMSQKGLNKKMARVRMYCDVVLKDVPLLNGDER